MNPLLLHLFILNFACCFLLVFPCLEFGAFDLNYYLFEGIGNRDCLMCRFPFCLGLLGVCKVIARFNHFIAHFNRFSFWSFDYFIQRFKGVARSRTDLRAMVIEANT